MARRTSPRLSVRLPPVTAQRYPFFVDPDRAHELLGHERERIKSGQSRSWRKDREAAAEQGEPGDRGSENLYQGGSTRVSPRISLSSSRRSSVPRRDSRPELTGSPSRVASRFPTTASRLYRHLAHRRGARSTRAPIAAARSPSASGSQPGAVPRMQAPTLPNQSDRTAWAIDVLRDRDSNSGQRIAQFLCQSQIWLQCRRNIRSLIRLSPAESARISTRLAQDWASLPHEPERRTLPVACQIGVRGSRRLIQPAGHQVAVGVERHGNRRVAHDDAQRLRVHARGDQQ